jgi:hypothetical protein
MVFIYKVVRRSHMRLHIGAVPSSPDFIPDPLWKSLGYFSPWMEKLVVIPIGILVAVLIAVLWFAFTPLQDVNPTMSLSTYLVSFVGTVFWFAYIPLLHVAPLMSLPAFIVSVAGVIVLHELLHAVVYPMSVGSSQTTLGFWPAGMMCYAHYDGELTRNRLLAVLLMPLIVISFVPLLVGAVAQVTSGWVAFISVFNAFGACGDMLIAGMVLFKIPATGIVRDQGGRFYWREHETLAA